MERLFLTLDEVLEIGRRSRSCRLGIGGGHANGDFGGEPPRPFHDCEDFKPCRSLTGCRD